MTSAPFANHLIILYPSVRPVPGSRKAKKPPPQIRAAAIHRPHVTAREKEKETATKTSKAGGYPSRGSDLPAGANVMDYCAASLPRARCLLPFAFLEASRGFFSPPSLTTVSFLLLLRLLLLLVHTSLFKVAGS